MAEGGQLSYANWMGELSEDVKNRSLNTVAIPGSHDSFSFYLDKKGPISPSAPKAIKSLHKGLGPLIAGTVHRWSVTQHKTVKQQLEAGIRYFDVRVSPRGTGSSQEYYFVHGLFGMKLSVLLGEVNAFLEEHSTEVVFIDFNHFYEMDDHSKLLDLIRGIFKFRLCPRKRMEQLTLKYLADNFLQVLVFYHHETSRSTSDMWHGSAIPSPWPNVGDPETLVKILEQHYQKGKPGDRFHVTQGILTPTNDMLVKKMTKSLKTAVSDRAAKPVVEWLKEKAPGNSKGINVCILDFVEMADFIPTVIGLNLKETDQK